MSLRAILCFACISLASTSSLRNRRQANANATPTLTDPNESMTFTIPQDTTIDPAIQYITQNEGSGMYADPSAEPLLTQQYQDPQMASSVNSTSSTDSTSSAVEGSGYNPSSTTVDPPVEQPVQVQRDSPLQQTSAANRQQNYTQQDNVLQNTVPQQTADPSQNYPADQQNVVSNNNAGNNGRVAMDAIPTSVASNTAVDQSSSNTIQVTGQHFTENFVVSDPMTDQMTFQITLPNDPKLLMTRLASAANALPMADKLDLAMQLTTLTNSLMRSVDTVFITTPPPMA